MSTTSTTVGPVSLAAGEGEAPWFLGGLATIKASANSTAGQFAVIEQLVPKGGGSPPDVHRREDEWF